MKLWIDDIRPAPEGYLWVKSVNEAIDVISTAFKRVDRYMQAGHDCFQERQYAERSKWYARANEAEIELIDLDHDAGDYAKDGGDYVRVLDWLETSGLNLHNVSFRLHTMNSVGRENMRRIIQKNGWREVYTA